MTTHTEVKAIQPGVTESASRRRRYSRSRRRDRDQLVAVGRRKHALDDTIEFGAVVEPRVDSVRMELTLKGQWRRYGSTRSNVS